VPAADNEPVGDLPGFSDDEEDAPVAASPPRKEQVKPSKPEVPKQHHSHTWLTNAL